MKMRRKRLRRGEEGENELAEGIRLCTEEMREEESRIGTLLIKGFLVYLIVMGEIGCFLTSLDIPCSWWVIQIGVLAGALFCPLLYHSRRWQNIGYFLLFFGMLFAAVWFRRYISSGVFAVANTLFQRASVFFGSSVRKSYTEQIGSRGVTIPAAMCYVGWAACILMNVLISRRMRYLAAGFFCLAILFLPLYLEREPSALFAFMLSAGLFLTFMFRKNGHYGLSMQNRRYHFDSGRRRLSYVYAGKTMFHVTEIVLVVSLVAISLTGAVMPQKKYDGMRSASAMKAGTMDAVENFMLIGILGLLNRYPSTGGLAGGTLGGVSSVWHDYETDLTVTYAPYSMDRLYLKSFTGDTYLPGQNKWDTRRDEEGRPVVESQKSVPELYKSHYQNGDKMSAMGHMRITNVAAAWEAYVPYYSLDAAKRIQPRYMEDYEYYLFHGNIHDLIPDSAEANQIYQDNFHEKDLEVPEENQEVISQFCEEAGLRKGMEPDAVIRQLRNYYQRNIPYTLRPGATPFRKDFVNYFLTENRRGYCAHFASAATLIFRYLGITARYAEGYVIDPSDLSGDGTVLPQEKYEYYYRGYSPIGETAVVSVDVTDAGAHAWVEVYDISRGWRVVDVTPAATETDGSGDGLLQQFLNFLLSDAGDGGASTGQSGQAPEVSVPGASRLLAFGRYAGLILALLAAAVLLFFVGKMAVRRIMWHGRYRASDLSDRLIMRYQACVRRRERRNPELAGRLNYREQLEWFAAQGSWQPDPQEFERAAAILERAGFSAEPVTEEELEWVLHKLM